MERPLLTPFVPFYRLGLAIDRWRRGRNPYRSIRPVISVGSITAGGAGKTPLVRWLIEEIQETAPVIVLSRGYGRRSRQPLIWRVGDPAPDPAELGDEPAMLARSLRNGLIAVGSDRRAHLQALDRDGVPGIAILDDGFQHWSITRDLDLVLVTAETFSTALLPAGNRREPLSALARARALLSYETGSLWEAVGRRSVIELELALEGVYALGTGERIESLGSVVLATGIARPERVLAELERRGVRVLEHCVYKDHAEYTSGMAQELEKLRGERGAEWIITTEKDAVKLERVAGERSRIAYVRMTTGGRGVSELRSLINPLLQ